MKEKLTSILLGVLLISTLFFNPRIHYYAFFSLFLFLPYFIHVVNLSLRKKLAQKDNFIGHEAQRQLVFFSSKGYHLLMLVATVLLGIGLMVVYLFLVTSDKPVKGLNLVLLLLSVASLISYLWLFYLNLRKKK
jgi:DMSO reductase anchor subunit